ncbi:JAB domain-containing protein [Draconibacterium sediminis]|uniref:DNA repair protein n=1 Tax=Draconibacterium sediminis TaxID=1544798 RepID=A0A0D8JA61_9BACT|nr:JAB domain-containing protein [Draconibacterium sediminis]KJF43634.1 DNA repair protein [Draconibacterium sediminis]
MKIDYFKVSEIKVSYTDKVKASERPQIGASKDAAQIFKHIFKNCIQHHEEFYVMLLNRGNKVLGVSCISKGGISGTVVDVRIILQLALKANASALIVSHNHPSGNLTASAADLNITEKLKNACQLIDLSLLDHLIVTDESYLSFADDGLL